MFLWCCQLVLLQDGGVLRRCGFVVYPLPLKFLGSISGIQGAPFWGHAVGGWFIEASGTCGSRLIMCDYLWVGGGAKIQAGLAWVSIRSLGGSLNATNSPWRRGRHQ